MNEDIQWMQRALLLAEYGRGNVSPNPMVGCVVVHQGRIIGEGWHRQYGGPHAEVRAIEDVERRENGHLLPESTVYVTLEPCSHTGKTPPCADLLVRKNVKRVVVCNDDPNPLVSGRGLARLKAAGISITTDVLKEEGLALNRRFFTSFVKQRPYVILKWAETADGFIGDKNGRPVKISGDLSTMRVHRWRAEEDAILVGYNTALSDNPSLNVRLSAGINPVRIVLDRNLKLPTSLHLFDRTQPTIVVNHLETSEPRNFPERYSENGETSYLKVSEGASELADILSGLHQRGIQSVLVEGGKKVLDSFLATGLWDEIRRCQSTKKIGKGIKAPLPMGVLSFFETVGDDQWTCYRHC